MAVETGSSFISATLRDRVDSKAKMGVLVHAHTIAQVTEDVRQQPRSQNNDGGLKPEVVKSPIPQKIP